MLYRVHLVTSSEAASIQAVLAIVCQKQSSHIYAAVLYNLEMSTIFFDIRMDVNGFAAIEMIKHLQSSLCSYIYSTTRQRNTPSRRPFFLTLSTRLRTVALAAEFRHQSQSFHRVRKHIGWQKFQCHRSASCSNAYDVCTMLYLTTILAAILFDCYVEKLQITFCIIPSSRCICSGRL